MPTNLSSASSCPQALKERGVQFVVAPYEADAQMAYLAIRGDVWAVVTEDSDLLAYGCPRVSKRQPAEVIKQLLERGRT
jgi:exonuclease-1